MFVLFERLRLEAKLKVQQHYVCWPMFFEVLCPVATVHGG